MPEICVNMHVICSYMLKICRCMPIMQEIWKNMQIYRLYQSNMQKICGENTQKNAALYDDGFFFWPNARALLPTFRTNCSDGVSFWPDGVSFCPDFHLQPLFFTMQSHTPFGDMYVHKTLENALRVAPSTCRAPPRELQRKCRGARAAAWMRWRECCSVRLAARCCDRKMRRSARCCIDAAASELQHQCWERRHQGGCVRAAWMHRRECGGTNVAACMRSVKAAA